MTKIISCSCEKILSVTIHDCEVQTFRAGGKGGQNQNKRNTGVRIIHHPSGAVGESREERSQLQNKRSAFIKMVRSREFMIWIKIKTSNQKATNEIIDKWMEPENLKIEVLKDGEWVLD